MRRRSGGCCIGMRIIAPRTRPLERKRGGPDLPLLQYVESLRHEEQLLKDGVHEMMHLVKFQEWCKKPKHMPPC